METQGSRMKGTIKDLKRDAGFGFIDTDKGDHFFHRSALELTTKAWEDLVIGMPVEFDSVPAERVDNRTRRKVQGWRALCVRILL